MRFEQLIADTLRKRAWRREGQVKLSAAVLKEA